MEKRNSMVYDEKAKVMILGTYHFKENDLHAVKEKPKDIMSDESQQELEEVLDKLRKFKPNKIAVEVQVENSEVLNNNYDKWCNGDLLSDEDRKGITDHRSEVEQLGFKLAKSLNHNKIYPIDVVGMIPFEKAFEYANNNKQEFMEHFNGKMKEHEKETNYMHNNLTIGEILKNLNEPKEIEEQHKVYIDFCKLGAGDNYCGADVLSKWYERNIRIFSNLQAIAQEDDRVLVIYGAGHLATLRELVKSSRNMELIEAIEYL
ncbi:DUF5694 domain-containing protein [Dethiothermospora halolimnae]|uniref:DUF5694 domain-containing protein n=1 Tax=Dethiothermospora halolimnae TaxID=3114390 RepID=UPI003CCC1015